jgi:two-component system response regulator CpxR
MQSPARCALLLIDDDVELCALVTEYFARKGYKVDCSHNGQEGLARAVREEHDLIILDGMLPVLDGVEVLRQLRKRTSIPVIMLTARTQERDRIAGLDAGADDYLPKPFGPDELFARIRAVLRRYESGNRLHPELLRVGPIELNPGTRVARRSGKTISLTEIEFQILELLMRSKGRVVSRDEVTAVLYQRKSTPYERSLDVHVSHLRKKIEEDGVTLIRTVRGIGYIVIENGDI